jgi:siroheme synthase (precorrin-2 oxidase/ferrochelatase)
LDKSLKPREISNPVWRRGRADFSLEGKVALITGGSHGIRKATALGFARAGADVVVASRKLPELEKVSEEVKGLGRKSLVIAADGRWGRGHKKPG